MQVQDTNDWLRSIGEFIGQVISAILGGIGAFFGGLRGWIESFLGGIASGMGVTAPTLFTWITLIAGLLFAWFAVTALRQGRLVGTVINGLIAAFLLGLIGA